MKIILSILLLVTSAFAATSGDESSTNKNNSELTATGKRINPNEPVGEVVLTISKEQIENGDFKNIGELLQAASKKSETEAKLPTQQSVQELVALMNSKELAENMVELAATSIVNNAALESTDRLFDEVNGPYYFSYISSFRPKATLIVKKYFTAQNMKDGLVNAYQHTFTQDEVNMLLEMSRSEAWKIWQEHNVELANGSIAVGVELVKKVVPELVELSDEALKEAGGPKQETSVIDLKPPSK
jgi:hypothetical protein